MSGLPAQRAGREIGPTDPGPAQYERPKITRLP